MPDTNPAPSKSRFKAVIGYASLGLVIFLAIAALRGYRDLQLARDRAAAIESEIAATETEGEYLARRLELLRNDPATLERLAREEFGMVKPGEVVVLMEPEPSATRPR